MTHPTLLHPDSRAFIPLIDRLGGILTQKGLLFATAESCTGGLLAGVCTDMPGSSRWFAGGVVAYADMVKERLLSVPAAMLREHGAVSDAVVRHMAGSVLRACGAQASVAVSGIAGPGGGSPDKAVGTVWIACALEEDGAVALQSRKFLFPGDRAAVRRAALAEALTGMLGLLEVESGS